LSNVYWLSLPKPRRVQSVPTSKSAELTAHVQLNAITFTSAVSIKILTVTY
jgi:hypothetical protein